MYQYLNLISLCLVFVAVEIKKRKKVLSWLFLLRRLSPSSDFSGASETELKTSLFAQPLSALCSDEDTLPRPIQVGARSLLTLLQKNPVEPECHCQAKPVWASLSFFPFWKMVFPPLSAVRKIPGHSHSRNELRSPLCLGRQSLPPSALVELGMLKVCTFRKISDQGFIEFMVRNPAFTWNDLRGRRPGVLLEGADLCLPGLPPLRRQGRGRQLITAGLEGKTGIRSHLLGLSQILEEELSWREPFITGSWLLFLSTVFILFLQPKHRLFLY